MATQFRNSDATTATLNLGATTSEVIIANCSRLRTITILGRGVAYVGIENCPALKIDEATFVKNSPALASIIVFDDQGLRMSWKRADYDRKVIEEERRASIMAGHHQPEYDWEPATPTAREAYETYEARPHLAARPNPRQPGGRPVSAQDVERMLEQESSSDEMNYETSSEEMDDYDY